LDLSLSQEFADRQRVIDRQRDQSKARNAAIRKLTEANEEKKQVDFDAIDQEMDQKEAKAKIEAEEEAAAEKATEGPEYDRRIPLSPEEVHQIQSDMYSGSPDEVLLERFNIPIKRKDIRSLAPGTWLNDEVSSFSKNCFFSCMIFVLLCR
jgi:Ulp1 family protease